MAVGCQGIPAFIKNRLRITSVPKRRKGYAGAIAYAEGGKLLLRKFLQLTPFFLPAPSAYPAFPTKTLQPPPPAAFPPLPTALTLLHYLFLLF